MIPVSPMMINLNIYENDIFDTYRLDINYKLIEISKSISKK